MDLLQMVKAAKSATSDFGTFWTELFKITQKLPKVFETFGDWDQDRINNIGVAKDARTGYVPNTRKVFTK